MVFKQNSMFLIFESKLTEKLTLLRFALADVCGSLFKDGDDETEDSGDVCPTRSNLKKYFSKTLLNTSKCFSHKQLE